MDTFSRETLHPWYVTGLIDGEGTFTYSRSGKQMGLYFGLKLTAAEEPLLEQMRTYFGGIGSIYSVLARSPRPGSGFTKTARYYRVTRIAELLRVVAHFDEYPLRSEKAKSYLIWREMVMLKQDFRNPDRDRLNALAAELSASCIRKQPGR